MQPGSAQRWATLVGGLLGACGGAPSPPSGLEPAAGSTPDAGSHAAAAEALPRVTGASPEQAPSATPPMAGDGATLGSSSTQSPDEPGAAPSAGDSAPEAAAPADVSTSSAAPGDAVFADGQLLEVRLTLVAADLLELEEHGDREQYVPAVAELTSAGRAPVRLSEVGVRHKGNWTLHHCWDDFGGARSHDGDCAKLSFKLKFDEYAADARLDGLKRLNLHASSGDASLMHELLGYHLFRAFGVDAPRAIPARVYVNDEPRGLFIAVEDVDGRYTRAHFPGASDGNLYKEIWPNPAFEDGELLLALETNEQIGDVSDMRSFADAVALGTLESFAAEVEPRLDLEALARYIAVDRALHNWDGITSFYEPRTPHNFYWYHDDGPDPRFHLIPWDLDDTYWPFDPYTHPEPPVSAPPIPDFNVSPAHCEPRPIWSADGSAGYMTPGRCDALLDALARRHWPRITELGHELLEGPFAPARQNALLDSWATSVAPIIAEDPTRDPIAWENAVADLRDVFERSASAFYAFLEEGLREEPPSPELAPEP